MKPLAVSLRRRRSFAGMPVFLAVCAGVLALLLPSLATAQIYYIAVDAQNNGRLRQINGNGTGDTGIALPFISVSNPAWSRDGNVVALTVVDPNAGSQRSTNVFGYAPATGALAMFTNYRDQFDPTPGSQAFSYTFPLYKAFSPDRGSLAVFSLVITSGSGDTSFLPVLEIFSLTAVANPVLVLVDLQRNGLNGGHHGGEGVDWAPNGSVLAAPLATSAPYLNGSGSSGQVTAIFQIDPVFGAKQSGQLRQLTSPRTDFNISAGSFVAEHDYMPKFSPNGAAIAYVRSFQSSNLLTSQVPNPDIQSLRILNLATGAETQIAQFNSGVYITSLDWSPDGSSLVFDLGLQPNSITGPQQQADPQTNQTYVINTDGSGLRQLRGNGNGQPSWRPLVNQPPVVPPTTPAFFNGQTALSNGVFFLRFPNGNPFGFYSFLADPNFIFHFDLGYLYVFDAKNSENGVFFYDFTSQSFFYTSPSFAFPYLYDFTLNTVLFYYPDPNNPERYNTNGTRFFFNFATSQVIVK